MHYRHGWFNIKINLNSWGGGRPPSQEPRVGHVDPGSPSNRRPPVEYISTGCPSILFCRVSMDIFLQGVHVYFSTGCPWIYFYRVSKDIFLQGVHGYITTGCPWIYYYRVSMDIFLHRYIIYIMLQSFFAVWSNHGFQRRMPFWCNIILRVLQCTLYNVQCTMYVQCAYV